MEKRKRALTDADLDALVAKMESTELDGLDEVGLALAESRADAALAARNGKWMLVSAPPRGEDAPQISDGELWSRIQADIAQGKPMPVSVSIAPGSMPDAFAEHGVRDIASARKARKALPYFVFATAALAAAFSFMVLRPSDRQGPVGSDGIQIKGASIRDGVSCQLSMKGPDEDRELVAPDSGMRQGALEAGAPYVVKGACSAKGYLHVAMTSGTAEVFNENLEVQVGSEPRPLLNVAAEPIGFTAPPSGDLVRVAVAFSDVPLADAERERWQAASRFGETMEARALLKELPALKWSGVFQLPTE